MANLNYSAQNIKHVYAQRDKQYKETINLFIERTGLYPKYAFGGFYFQIGEIFQEQNNGLPYTFKGYGGVDCLGNINGKTKGLLYYKNKAIKSSFEALTSRLQAISDEVRENITYIEKQHGKPNIQHALLT